MECSRAIEKKRMLELELNHLHGLMAILVDKEIERLRVDIHNAIVSMKPPTEPGPDNIKIPIEGESMLSKVPAEFGLSSAESTEEFRKTLTSELEELMKSIVQFPYTSEFIKKVIDHTQAHLKKQLRFESAVFGPKGDQIPQMDYDTAATKRDRLYAEITLIRSRANEREVNLGYLLKLVDAVIDHAEDYLKRQHLYEPAGAKRNRLHEEMKFIRDTSKGRVESNDVSYLLALVEAEHDRLCDCLDEIEIEMTSPLDVLGIPVEGEFMLMNIPDDFWLVSASLTENFIDELRKELKWILSLDEDIPLTFQFIHRVIGYAQTYRNEKRPYEVTVFGKPRR